MVLVVVKIMQRQKNGSEKLVIMDYNLGVLNMPS